MMNKWTISILISCLAVFSLQAEVLDEWAFENDDAAGSTLNETTNIGNDDSSFESGGAGVLETDGSSMLRATPATGSLWTGGTELDAALGTVSTGKHYLRYDLEYDVTSDTAAGAALGISFVDGSTEVGMALAHDSTGTNTVDWAEGVSDLLPLSGTLTAIAELDLDQSPATMRIWYGTDADTFSYDTASFTSTVSVTSISELRVRTSGTSTGTADDYIGVENIRRTDLWADIISDIPDYTAAPSVAVTLEDSLGGVMGTGETNEVRVIMAGSISPAVNVTSALTHDGAAGDVGITLISGGGETLKPNEVVTNVYEVVGSVGGTYTLTAQAYVDGAANGTAGTLGLAVGSNISISSVVENDLGGLYPGDVEPGETFDVVVISENDGVSDIFSITNSITAKNSGYFTNLPLKEIYSSLEVGATTTTTYQVSCSADTPDGLQTLYLLNQSGDNVWTQEIEIDVRREETFSVSTNDVSLVVIAGSTGSADLTIENTGNVALPFTVMADGVPALYTVTTSRVERYEFFGTKEGVVEFVDDATNSVTMNLSEELSLCGLSCNQFTVGRDGTVHMMYDGVEIGSVFPYQTTELVDADSVRATQSASALIVAWGNEATEDGESLEFQTRIKTDGTIQFAYESGEWGEAVVGVSCDTTGYEKTVSGDLSEIADDGVTLSPLSWVSYSPISGTLAAAGAQSLSITADATNMDIGTYPFTLSVGIGDSSEVIAVSVIVEPLNPSLTVTPPTDWEGPEGLWSTSSMIVSNSGNVAVGVTVLGGTYGVEFIDDDTWVDPQYYVPNYLTEGQLGTELLEIGFDFSFYGADFSTVIVNQGGALTLADGFVLSPFGTELEWDDSVSKVSYLRDGIYKRFTVTWENMVSGSSDKQTFQAVLFENGDVSFNYHDINGDGYDAASIGLFGSANSTAELITDDTVVETSYVTYVTNQVPNWWNDQFTEEITPVSTNTVVTTNSVVPPQSLEFSANHIISSADIPGELEPGAVYLATLTADARDLVSGDMVTETITFAIDSGSDSDSEQRINLDDSYTWVKSSAESGDDFGTGNTRDWYIESPTFSEPSAVYLDGTELEKKSSTDSLGTATWAWGDSNDLGYDTLYVRIDSTVAGAIPSADSNISVLAVGSGASGVNAEVTFTVTDPVLASPVMSAAQAVLAWGAEEVDISIEDQSDGKKLLSWPAASDGFKRTYTIYYTTSLSSDWIWLAETDEAVYVDESHLDVDTIFYKVTVQ